jgi:predicted dehydrogenase
MKIAFAGFRHSHIFGLYKEAISDKRVTVLGSFEENDDARNDAKRLLNANFCYKKYQEILDDCRVDAVAIGDYYGKRGGMIIEALEHGKHIICDKPICTDISELREIERLCREKNLALVCMLDLRYMPQTECVRELISNGKIGKVINISFTGQHCLDYGVRPSWYFEEGCHGGTVNDIAVHGVDLVRYITGKNLTKPIAVAEKNAYAEREPNFKDCAHFIADMDGVTLMADVSYSAPKCCEILPTYWDFTIFGLDGMIKFNYASPDILIYKSNVEKIECAPRKIAHLDDLIFRMKNREESLSKTLDMIESQRQTLKIQGFGKS